MHEVRFGVFIAGSADSQGAHRRQLGFGGIAIWSRPCVEGEKTILPKKPRSVGLYMHFFSIRLRNPGRIPVISTFLGTNFRVSLWKHENYLSRADFQSFGPVFSAWFFYIKIKHILDEIPPFLVYYLPLLRGEENNQMRGEKEKRFSERRRRRGGSRFLRCFSLSIFPHPFPVCFFFQPVFGDSERKKSTSFSLFPTTIFSCREEGRVDKNEGLFLKLLPVPPLLLGSSEGKKGEKEAF